FTKDTPFDEALNLILTTNQLFAKRVGPDRLLIIPDTKQKREQFDDLQIRTFYLSNAKAKDMANLLRTILETKRVYVNEPLNTVVIRDEPDKISLAEQIILANDRQDSEVLFDIEVLEVNRTKSRRTGLNFAKQAGFGFFPNKADGSDPTSFSTNASTFSFKNLTDIGPGSYLFTFPSSVLLNFFKQESDAKTLSNPKLRVLNNQKASINVGDKQPILLSTTNVLPGQAATGAVPTTSTVTSIEFKDTGIKVTVEPTIHLNNAITLRLQIEVTRLGDRVILQTSPEISQFRFGTRTADTALNMRDGETVILGGLIAEEDRRSREAVPGIDDIPGLGSLLSNSNTDKVTTEVILVITPHIVRSVQTPQLAKQTLWSGTANQYTTKPMFSQPKPMVSALTTMETTDSSESSAFPQDPQLTEGKTPTQKSVEHDSGEAAQSATGAPRLQILPAAASIKVGEQISLTIQGQDLSSIGKTSLTLTYDPAVVSFSQAVEGTLWTSQQMPPSLTVSAVPHLGQLVLQMGQQGIGIQGSGSLATVVFEATGTGTSNIQIQNSSVLGANAQPIPVSVQHGRILVE
ncbi:MAG: cohesin domain-containing protein, partial [Nitrospirota bacterium]|nr:cohesin domain-containing protein [Nitrospirota bacterium]